MSDAREALLASLVPSFELVTVDGACVVEAVGEIDFHADDELDSALAAARSRGQSVVIDLSEVTFIDSSALGRLLAFDRQLASAGGSFAVVAGGREVARALELTRLDRILRTAPNREEAIVAVTDRKPR
jgi:anti-sigma B factor antagonist